MMVTMARPSGPLVSMFSRKLTNSTLRWLSSSKTSRKCLVDLASRSNAQTRTTSKRPWRASLMMRSRAGRSGPRPADAVIGKDFDDFKAALRGHRLEVQQLGFGVLVQGADVEIECRALHNDSPFPQRPSRAGVSAGPERTIVALWVTMPCWSTIVPSRSRRMNRTQKTSVSHGESWRPRTGMRQ